MKTEDLIARLGQDPAPVPSHPSWRLLAAGLAAGAVVAFMFVWAALGLRHDLWTMDGAGPGLVKFLYPLALAAVALPLVRRLSLPGWTAGRLALLAGLPVAIVALAALLQWQNAAPDTHAALLFGNSYLVCPWLILTVSLPLLAGTLWAMRQLAPTHREAGLAAGLLSGAAGTIVYALHCTETSLVFVALWYSLGMALTALTGRFAGRALLRW